MNRPDAIEYRIDRVAASEDVGAGFSRLDRGRPAGTGGQSVSAYRI